MSLRDDLKNVSDTAIEQLSARFHDLPRPLLAAIGAGDIAVERLAALRESLTGSLPSGGTPSGDDVKAFASDLPARAQQVAGEVAQNLEQFASSAPAKAQKLISELPDKAAEFADSLSPENVRGTVEAYTQMVAMIYDNLAERGGKAVAKVRPDAASGSAPSAPARASAKASPTSETRTSGATRSTVRSAAGAKTSGASRTAGSTTRKASGTASGGSAAAGRASTAKPTGRKATGTKVSGSAAGRSTTRRATGARPKGDSKA
jgi:hypothetical protein